MGRPGQARSGVDCTVNGVTTTTTAMAAAMVEKGETAVAVDGVMCSLRASVPRCTQHQADDSNFGAFRFAVQMHAR